MMFWDNIWRRKNLNSVITNDVSYYKKEIFGKKAIDKN
jgi:hypothetical protein